MSSTRVYKIKAFKSQFYALHLTILEIKTQKSEPSWKVGNKTKDLHNFIFK